MNVLKPSYIAMMGAISLLAMQTALAKDSITVYYPIKHDISPPLRDIPNENNLSNTLKIMPSSHFSSLFKNLSRNTDTALQTSPAKNVLLPLFEFQGIGIGMTNYQIHFSPANANGSVGLTEYVQWVNADFAVFDKTTGLLAAGFPKAGNTLWSGFGGVCQTSNQGQPIVKYDQLANRWVMTQTAYTNINTGPFFQCIAVSTTGDATGSYYRYAYQFSAFNSDPKLSLWPDAYYMSFIMTNGPEACAVDRSKMLSGLAATMQCVTLSSSNTGPLIAADLDGQTLPPVGSPGYFMSIKAPNNLLFYKYHVDFTTPSNSALTGPTPIFVANFTPSCASTSGNACAIQPNSTVRLDTLSDRIMHRLAYRQFATYGSIVATHTIEGPGPDFAPAPRWYELRFPNSSTVPTVFQEVTRAPDTMNRFIGSIAMDKLGNIALGYTVTSSLIFPSPELAWHNASDPQNTMNNYQPLVTGLGSQNNNLTRWGDYNSMSIDPIDDCTFWYTNQYLKTTGSFNWSTSVVSFKLAGCT